MNSPTNAALTLPIGAAGARYPIVQVSLAVKQLAPAMQIYHRAFGWAPWQISDHVAPAFHDAVFRGQRVASTLRGAEVWVGGLCFELLEPLQGPSLWTEYLAARGEGAVSLAFLLPTRNDADAVERAFRDHFGIEPIWSEDIGANVHYYYLDSVAQFGCYIEFASVELAAPEGADGADEPGEAYPATSAVQIPAPASGICYPKITEVSLAVRDLTATMAAYHRAFGWEPWTVFDSTGEQPLFDTCEAGGRPTDPFRLRWGEVRVGDDLVLQLVEPAGGADPWQQHLESVGEGIASISMTFETEDEARRVETAFAAMGCGVRARGRIGTDAERFYLDTARDFKLAIGSGFGRLPDAVRPAATGGKHG